LTRSVPRSSTRVERRRLERDERKAQQRRPAHTARQTSPMLIFTGVAFVVGLVIVGFLVLQQLTATSSPNLIEPNVNVPAGLADGRTLGTANAPVTIQVWSDFQCPACRTLAITVEPSIVQQFVVPGVVKLIYSDAAYQGRNGSDPNWDESVAAGAAARCAADQGLFWQLHDWLFTNWQGENVGSFRQDRLRAIAQGAGLDMAGYDSCMAAGDKQAAVRAETNQAAAAGVDHTPTLIINGTAYVGVPTYDQLVAMINEAAASSTP
jgi:protein-disulfide isomerase